MANPDYEDYEQQAKDELWAAWQSRHDTTPEVVANTIARAQVYATLHLAAMVGRRPLK